VELRSQTQYTYKVSRVYANKEWKIPKKIHGFNPVAILVTLLYILHLVNRESEEEIKRAKYFASTLLIK
jgi:hydrogenase maturation factor